MRVVLRSGNTLQLTCRHQLTGQDARPSLDALSAVVSELHLLLVEADRVAENAEYGTRTHDIIVESLLLEVSIERNEK